MPSAKCKRYTRKKGTESGEKPILIVTEGTKTEPKYLEGLRQTLHLAATRIEVVPADGTDPRSVVKTAIEMMKAQNRLAKRGEGLEYEEVWVVFDSEDRLGTNELNGAISMGEAAGVSIAMTVPCFEYWLVLHYEYTTEYMVDYSKVEARLKGHVPHYDKANPPVDDLMQLVPDAVVNSERCVAHMEQSGGVLPRSDVHLLVRVMNEATRDHFRVL